MKTGSFTHLRFQLLRSLLWVTVGLLAISLIAGFRTGVSGGVEVLVGGLIVLTPNLWLALKISSGRGASNSALMGLAKYSLTGAGFAGWFALNPDSNGGLVLIGAICVLIATPVLTAISRSDN